MPGAPSFLSLPFHLLLPEFYFSSLFLSAAYTSPTPILSPPATKTYEETPVLLSSLLSPLYSILPSISLKALPFLLSTETLGLTPLQFRRSNRSIKNPTSVSTSPRRSRARYPSPFSIGKVCFLLKFQWLLRF